jgi:hypothetical protein
MTNVIAFDPVQKTPASKARVGVLAAATVERLRAADRQCEVQSERDQNQARALMDMELAARKLYALFGCGARTWIDLVHSKVAADQRTDPTDENAMRCKAAHGRELIENGIALIRDGEGKGRAVWFLENELERIKG